MSDRPPIFGKTAFSDPFTNPFGSPFIGKGAFHPANFGDLRLDLDAFRDVFAPSLPFVEGWRDQSGNENNAAKTIDARRPSLNSTLINGNPALVFTTTGGAGTEKDLSVNDSPTIGNISGDHAVYVVCRPSDLAGFPTFLGKDANTWRFLLDSTAPPFGRPRSIATGPGPVVEQLFGTSVVTINTNFVLEFHYDVGTLEKFTANGADFGSEASTILSIGLSILPLFIGQGGAGSQFYNGGIGRILIYASLPTLAERNSIVQGLGAQFGIATVPILT